MSHPNEDLINKFYSAFQKKDSKTMNDCYSDSIEFTDEAFKDLKGTTAKAMWSMLCEKATRAEISNSCSVPVLPPRALRRGVKKQNPRIYREVRAKG